MKELERGEMDCKRDVRETKGFERLTTSRKLVSTYKRLVPARKIPRFLTAQNLREVFAMTCRWNCPLQFAVAPLTSPAVIIVAVGSMQTSCAARRVSAFLLNSTLFTRFLGFSLKLVVVNLFVGQPPTKYHHYQLRRHSFSPS